MAMQKTVSLAQVRILGAGDYVSLTAFQIDTKENSHGVMMVTLCLDGNDQNNQTKDWAGEQIQAVSDEGDILFSGECTECYKDIMAQYCEVTLYVMSQSYQADITCNSRTFQDEGKTFRTVVEQVLEPYGASIFIEKDASIWRVLVQEEETDWAFLLRIANQYGYNVYVDVTSDKLSVSFGTTVRHSTGFFAEPMILLETKNPQEMRLKTANQGENAGLFHYASEEICSYNPYATAGTGIAGKLVTSSKISAERGVLVNYASTALPQDAITDSESMLAEITESNVLSGEVIAVNQKTIKVKFDVDESQNEAEAKEFPYENTLSNSFYCMPEIHDRVFGYIDNRGVAVILGCKRKAVNDDFFDKPEEKSLTALNNMIHFSTNTLTLSANREETDKDKAKRISIVLDKDDGIDIHSHGSIRVISDKKIGFLAGESIPDVATIENDFKNAELVGKNAYLEDKGAELTKVSWGGEFWNQFSKSYVEFFNAITFNELRTDFKNYVHPAEKEAVRESYEKGTFYMGAEQISLNVGSSYFICGSIVFDNLSIIYINSAMFHWLGFERKKDYQQVVEQFSDGWEIGWDIGTLILDIVSVVVFCFCPAAGLIMMGISAAISVMRGDYCGGLLGCLPIVGKAGKCTKILQKFPKIAKVLGPAGKICEKIDDGQGILMLGNQSLSYYKKIKNGQMEWNDWTQVGLIVVSFITGKITDKHFNNQCDSNGMYNGSLLGIFEKSNTEGADTPTVDVDGTHPSLEVEGDTPNIDVDTDTTQTVTEGADPVNMVTGALTEQHTDLRIKDIRGDYAVVRTYKSTYENPGRMLGSRWIFQFETSLYRKDKYISVYLPDAHKEQFSLTEEGWINQIPGKEKYSLIETVDGYWLEEKETLNTYRFNKDGQILDISDSYGNKTHYSYIGKLISKITLESGMELNLNYEGNKLSLLQDSQGREYHYQYEGELLTAVTYPNGGTIRYEYTKEGYITRVFNENGKCYVTNQFDRKGRVIHQHTADGEEYVFFYNDEKKENTLTTLGLNRSVTYCYNRNYLIEKTIFDDGTTEEKKYDANEKVIWEKDRLGREIWREYNAEGKLLKETVPNGLCTCYEYDELGNCLAQEDNTGRKIKYEYDENGGLSAASFMTEDGVYLTTRYERDGHGRIIRQKYADGSEKAWEYGRPFSQPTSFMGAEGENFTYELDEYGRKMIFHGTRGDVYYGYNANHFVTMVRDEENNATRYQYDLTGNKIGVLQPEDAFADDGIGITYNYDLMDHLIGIENACGEGYSREVNSEGKTLRLQNKAENSYATEYRYDADGRRTHIYYPDGGVQRNFYDACGNLIKQVAPEDYEEKTDSGKGITFAYDSMNRLIGVWDRDGKQIRAITYDLVGRIIKDSRGKQMETRDADGVEVGILYRYNHAGWLLEKRVPVNIEGGEILYRLTTYAYDKRGHRTTEKRYLDYQKKESVGGRVLLIQRQFDKSGRLIKVTDSVGSSIEYRYDAHNKITFEKRKIREGVYQEKTYTYTKSGNLQSIESSADGKGSGRLTARTSFQYNRNGKVTRITTPTGNEIHFTYDRSNRVIKEEYCQKNGKLYSVTEYFHDGEGRVNRVVTNGRSTEYGYDCKGRRNRICEAGVTNAWIYDKNGRIIREIGSSEFRKNGFAGKGKSFCYANGRLSAIYRMDGSLDREYSYSTYGEMESQREGSGAQISLTYDLAGRRIYAETESGATQSWNYDPWGNVIEVTDGNGNHTEFSYDGWGKVVRINRADGGVENYTYDAAGNLTEAVDAMGHRMSFLYNSQNQLEQRIDQAGESEYWNYDAEGRCCLYKNRNGQEVAYTYNMLGSLLSRKSVGEQSIAESYGYTPEGRLDYAIGGGMRYDYVYDEVGRLSEKKASGRVLLSYTYDEDGRLSSRKDISGKETDYRYDENGLLGSILDNGMEMASYSYTPDGRIAEVTSGPLRSSYEYTPEGSLASLNTLMGEEQLVSNSYAYDHNGNCIRKETLAGVTEYGYDVMNRLSEQSGPFGRECYSYDYADNRTSREWFSPMDIESGDIAAEQLPDMDWASNGVVLGRESYEYDERNRLVRSILSDGSNEEDIIREYLYDNQGNLLSDGQAAYIYDAFNRMERAELKDGQTQINRYDAEGLRHEMEENGKLVQFLYSGRNVVAENESDGNIIRYIRGIGLVSSDSEKAKSYYHYACDELGSVTHVVSGASKIASGAGENASAAPQILNRYAYDAFGNTVLCEETVSNRFRFAGEQFDTVTGQYYLRARFYNPVIGRFLQEDDYYGDGLNLYAYCRNNPVMYVDPSGHGTESAADKQSTPDDTTADFYEDIFDSQRESIPEYEDYLDELRNGGDGLDGVEGDGKEPMTWNEFQHANKGKYTRQEMSEAYAQYKRDYYQNSPNTSAGKPVHGNSLSDTRTNYGYVLVDRDTNAILKFGETIHPTTRYSKSYLDANNAKMIILEQGNKLDIHLWQHDMNEYYFYKYNEYPPLNSGGW